MEFVLNTWFPFLFQNSQSVFVEHVCVNLGHPGQTWNRAHGHMADKADLFLTFVFTPLETFLYFSPLSRFFFANRFPTCSIMV